MFKQFARILLKGACECRLLYVQVGCIVMNGRCIYFGNTATNLAMGAIFALFKVIMLPFKL
jgi:hypothetical protein